MNKIDKTFDISGHTLVSLVDKNKKHIVIPEGVKYIDTSAFSGEHIETIECPSTLKAIESNAFSDCSNLRKITFKENSLEVINDFAFASCESLEEIKLPNSLTIIGNYAFMNCGFKEIHIPENVHAIDFGICSGCFNLNKITVDKNNLIYSDMDCNVIYNKETDTIIQGCNTSIMPKETKLIYSYSFVNSKYKNLELPNELESIGFRAFYNSTIESKELILPSTLKEVCNGAFGDIKTLKKLIIQNENNLYIDDYAFSGCENLKEVFIFNKGNIRIEEYAFMDTSNDLLIYVENTEKLNEVFRERYKSIIKPFTLDMLIDQGKSLKQINKIFKNSKEAKER